MNLETYVRYGQIWLLILATFAFVYAIYVGPRINRLRFRGAHVYYSYVFILVLSAVQIKQCVQILNAPITTSWWEPFLCKHISLLVYVAILDCINRCDHCKIKKENGSNT